MMSFATVKQWRLMFTFCLPERDMIGLSAETTGLPPALRVPARQHLQHTHPSPYSSNGDSAYVHTAGFNNKLEPVGQCHGSALALVSIRIRLQFRIRIQGFITKYCKKIKNVQATGDALGLESASSKHEIL
jgi:hypothetical protein